VGMDAAKTFTTLSSDTKNDVPAKGVEDTSLKQKKNGTESTHGQTHGQAHGRAAGPEPGYKGKEREMEGNMDVCLDSLSLDLDTDFTTKS